ncbi:hypothetical protein EDB85DRAFT_1895715 [Lactarius pseudohatsudake]|nr:hypothetical protein EDB85DRAFT_1895715 [Lactarius pseudohatsudake]
MNKAPRAWLGRVITVGGCLSACRVMAALLRVVREEAHMGDVDAQLVALGKLEDCELVIVAEVGRVPLGLVHERRRQVGCTGASTSSRIGWRGWPITHPEPDARAAHVNTILVMEVIHQDLSDALDGNLLAFGLQLGIAVPSARRVALVSDQVAG